MKRTLEVFAAIRHTRAGDKLIGVTTHRSDAMSRARIAAEEAGRSYGYGSASVFKATLKLSGRALKPTKDEL